MISQIGQPSKYIKLISSIGSLSSLNSRLIHHSSSLNKTLVCNQLIKSLDTINTTNSLRPHSLQNPNHVTKNYSTDTTGKGTDNDPMRKPTLEHLLTVEERMKQHLPRFLKETHPIGLYTPDVVFENLYYETPKTTM